MSVAHIDLNVARSFGNVLRDTYPRRVRVCVMGNNSALQAVRGSMVVDVRDALAMDALVAAIRDAVMQLHGCCTCVPGAPGAPGTSGDTP